MKHKTIKTINIGGMSCNHCVAAVKKALEELKGVKNVDINLPAGKADIIFYESVTDLEKIKEAVEDAGYEFSL